MFKLGCDHGEEGLQFPINKEKKVSSLGIGDVLWSSEVLYLKNVFAIMLQYVVGRDDTRDLGPNAKPSTSPFISCDPNLYNF